MDTPKNDKPGWSGARLKEARERAGLSTSQAGRRVKVSSHIWRSWESGARSPRAADIYDVAAAVETSVTFLFGEIAS